jgi:hypothetical protein
MAIPVNVFISYSHQDREYLTLLKTYINEGICPDLDIWDDRAIEPGARWDDEIQNRLKEADVVLLLVSQFFLESAYINKVELNIALDRNTNRECTVIPVFVRYCPVFSKGNLINKQITDLQGYPKNNDKNRRFFSEMDEDKFTHLTDIHNGIIDIVEKIRNKKAEEKAAADNKKEQLEIIEKLRNNKKIYLALPGSETGFKMHTQFCYTAKVKKEYVNWPFEIVPDISQFTDLSEINLYSNQPLIQHLIESIYSIHIITSPGEISSGLVKQQLELATGINNKKAFSRSIVWLKSYELIENLGQDIRSRYSIVAGMDVEKLFDLIDSFEKERKQRIDTEVSQHFSTNLKTMMIYDFTRDHNNAFRKDIKTRLEDRKVCSVRLNTPDETLEALKEQLSKCHGAILVYGGSETPWYLYRQALLYDAQMLKSKAVCVGNPNIEEKMRSDITMNEFIVIREDTGMQDLQKSLDFFLNKLTA